MGSTREFNGIGTEPAPVHKHSTRPARECGQSVSKSLWFQWYLHGYSNILKNALLPNAICRVFTFPHKPEVILVKMILLKSNEAHLHLLENWWITAHKWLREKWKHLQEYVMSFAKHPHQHMCSHISELFSCGNKILSFNSLVIYIICSNYFYFLKASCKC